MPQFVDERRHELDMIFNFDTIRINRDGRNWRKWSLPELKAIYARQEKSLGKHGWNAIFLGNHDNPRLVSAFGDDGAEYRERSAKLLATMLLTLKGTPYLYQGDELGMTNYPFRSIEEYDDVEAKNAGRHDVLTGRESAGHYLENLARVSRDHARTPMQWDTSPHAGFTTASHPWFAVNPNFKQINAARAVADPDSIFFYTRKLIALRRSSLAFVYGDYFDLEPEHPHLFLYSRTLDRERYLIALNVSPETVPTPASWDDASGRIVLDNVTGADIRADLLPWEARMIESPLVS